MKKQKQERLLLVAMLISMCIWGFAWSSAKTLTSYGDAIALAFMRFLITTLFLPILMFFTGQKIKVEAKGLPFILGAGIFMFLYAICFFVGVNKGLPGAGGVLVTTTNPIFAYLIGLLISRILPKKWEILGLLLGVVAGVILLKVWSNTDGIFAFGNSYFLLGALVWAIMSKFSSRANGYGNALATSFWLHLVSLVGLSLLVDYNEITLMIGRSDTKFWLNMFYFAIINSALATSCFLFATSKLGPEKASTFIFIVPAMSALGAWIFHNEIVQWNTFVGGILGIIAVFVINGKFGKKNESEH